MFQWKDNTIVGSCARRTGGNRPHHWTQCQSLQEGKGEHEVLGYRYVPFVSTVFFGVLFGVGRQG